MLPHTAARCALDMVKHGLLSYMLIFIKKVGRAEDVVVKESAL